MSHGLIFEEKCAAAVKNLAQIHDQLARSDLHPDTKRELKLKEQDAKIHLQWLLRSAKKTSE